MKTIATISMLVSALVVSPTVSAQVGGAGGRREPPPTSTPVAHDPSLLSQAQDYLKRLFLELTSDQKRAPHSQT